MERLRTLVRTKRAERAKLKAILSKTEDESSSFAAHRASRLLF